jgi:hypothetical protein
VVTLLGGGTLETHHILPIFSEDILLLGDFVHVA